LNNNLNLLSILVCPITGLKLKRSRPEFLKLLNECIKKKQIKNRRGRLVSKPVDDFYVTTDLKIGYMQIKKIPFIVEEEAIEIGFVSNREWQALLKKLKGFKR
jgi:uncharacterized protein YbaR (Trm112 family)